MITQENKKITIDEKDAEKLLTHRKLGTSYDKGKKELTFVTNRSSGVGFRLVHDGKKAFIIEGTKKNITETIHNIEEFVTEKGALDRIKVLGLEYEAPASTEMGRAA